MKVLMTGFEPFGGESVNPSYQAVERIADIPTGVELVRAELPTVFGESAIKLAALLEEHHPDVVICVGQSGGRFGITPERVAINVDDARIADNAGNTPVDQRIVAEGQNAYFSTLPIKAMVEGIKEAGIPASVSNTAGTYVCNHLAYHLGYLNESRYEGKLSCGFIHVPYAAEQVVSKPNTPSMSLRDITKALEIAIAVATR